MSAVTMTGLWKGFGATPVLRGIDLDVPNGEILSVLGSSGCGKTTLLRIVAGFLAPDQGTVAFDGTVVAGDGVFVPAQERRVGYVPQEGALFPHLDVRGNILFGLPKRERSKERLAEMLDLAELPRNVAGSYPHQLSGGQQQRVALARALAPRPRVVLLDEPFSSLDAALRESAGREVARVLRAAGATAILVTHDQGEALSLADRVAVMRQGVLAQVGAPVDLYRAPADVEVGTFVGGATVLLGTVRGGTGTCVLGDLPLDPHELVDGEARLLVRPEQVEVGTSGPVKAVVEEVGFFGHFATVRLLLDDGTTLVAKVPAHTVPATGERVGVGVRGTVRAYR